jgi:DNA processing protein
METLPILALQNISGIGNATLRKILSLPNIVEPANSHDLYEIIITAKSKFGKIPALDFNVVDNAWNKAIEIIDLSEKNYIKIIGRCSPYYPPLLSKIDNPPELLHIKGNIDALCENCVAIIGTRNPTEDGICLATNSGEKLVENGYAIVSGLAKGIDAAAHEGALNANGKTLAVLAHGLDTVYPKQNEKLAEKIIENNGALVSEYFWGKKSTKGSFVERDRIQSGLSLSVLVIETKEKGGTMHTAKYCTDQKRLLTVLKPHEDDSINEHYSGNVKLIKDKLADFILKYDEKSLNCLFTYNYFKEHESHFEENHYNFDFIKTALKDKLNSNASALFAESILNMSFSCKKDCQKCELFNDCKLIDQGFPELCSYNKKDINKTLIQKKLKIKKIN